MVAHARPLLPLPVGKQDHPALHRAGLPPATPDVPLVTTGWFPGSEFNFNHFGAEARVGFVTDHQRKCIRVFGVIKGSEIPTVSSIRNGDHMLFNKAVSALQADPLYKGFTVKADYNTYSHPSGVEPNRKRF